MYASTSQVDSHYSVTDYRHVSRQAAERHAQLEAVKESRIQRNATKREARRQRGHAAVTANASA
jgi:hypothetical protein